MPTIQSSDETFDYQHGRRYHGFCRGIYMYPNDEKEQDRLDIFHKLFLVARNQELCEAPFAKFYGPLRILDLGSGTGIWAIEMGLKYPEAEVIGMDLSLIHPQGIPQNVRFIRANFESEWVLGRESFDFIHFRQGLGSVTSWPNILAKIYSHLKPGKGWFESVEIDINHKFADETLGPTSIVHEWQNNLKHASLLVGKPLEYERRMGDYLAAAGFVDIQENVIALPTNGWSEDPREKSLGTWYHLGMKEALEGLSLGPLCRVLRWPSGHTMDYLRRVRKDLTNPSLRPYTFIHVWIARRPPAVPNTS